jgi:death-on-curing protein
MIRALTRDAVLAIHDAVIAETGGTAGVRDDGPILSAIDAPFQVVFGHDPFPSIEAKAARLLFGLASDHPFVDGNKRTAWLAMLLFLRLNGKDLVVPPDEAEPLVLGVADGTRSLQDLTAWIARLAINRT